MSPTDAGRRREDRAQPIWTVERLSFANFSFDSILKFHIIILTFVIPLAVPMWKGCKFLPHRKFSDNSIQLLLLQHIAIILVMMIFLRPHKIEWLLDKSERKSKNASRGRQEKRGKCDLLVQRIVVNPSLVFAWITQVKSSHVVLLKLFSFVCE